MTIKELKKLIANVPDEAEVVINTAGTQCKPAKLFAEMIIAPAGTTHTYTGYAFVIEPEGETYTIQKDSLTYPLEPYKPGGGQ